MRRVEAGESFFVVSGDRPIAEVRALPERNAEPRPFALAAGQFRVPDDFDAPLPDHILEEFEGR